MKPSRFKSTVLALVGVVCFVTLTVQLLLKLHKIQPDSMATLNNFSVAEFQSSSSANWEKTTLPHDWYMDRLNVTELQYRFSFTTSPLQKELYALYIPVISQNAVAFLNGVEVGNGGSTEEPIARNWPRPLIFPIAPEAFIDGKNELKLNVYSGPAGRGFLPAFYLGKWTDLVQSYNYRKLLKQTVLGAFIVVFVTCAFFLFSIVLRRANSSEYIWASAICLGLAGNLLPVFFQHYAISEFYLDWLQRICFGYTVLFILLFVNRYFKLQMKKVEVTASTIVVLLSVLCFIVGTKSEFQWLYFTYGPALWGVCNIAIGSVPIMAALRIAIESGNRAALYIVCVGCVMFVLGLHDTLMMSGFLSHENGYLSQYICPLVALLLFAMLISKLIEASADLEALNSSLEQRVQNSNRALVASYENVRKMERKQILATERERFNRDMHDGLGGHLSTALALAELDVGPNASLTRTIRDATEEMRLMIDTAEAMGEDIGVILGTLREKLQRQAEAGGFRLIWRIEDTASIDMIGHGAALNLVRIVQEAVTNAVRHSGGDTVHVHVRDGDQLVVLEVKDNGRCLNLGNGGGNGIVNIKQRAKELGAKIGINKHSEFGGLCVTLSIPV